MAIPRDFGIERLLREFALPRLPSIASSQSSAGHASSETRLRMTIQAHLPSSKLPGTSVESRIGLVLG